MMSSETRRNQDKVTFTMSSLLHSSSLQQARFEAAPNHWAKGRRSLKRGIVTLIGLALITATSTAWANEITRGRATYLQYCASCHGLTADGDGPVAPSLSIPPANLRRLGERYGNPLPEDQIARFIDGRADVRAHGPRDMPVWGFRFYPEARGSERAVGNRIADLVAYLQSIQTAAHVASNRIKCWLSGRA